MSVPRVTEENGHPRVWTRPHAVTVAARLVLLALVAVLSVVITQQVWPLVWIALLAVASVPAVLAPAARGVGSLVRGAEVILVCLGSANVASLAGRGSAAAALLPYLVVPVVAAALYRRRGETVLLVTLALAALAVLGTADDRILDSGYVAVCAEWLLLSSVAGATAFSVQRTLQERPEQPQPYVEATRLLTQLRSVARQLPGVTLDPGGIAEHLLDELRMIAPTHRAAVLSASGGGRLVVLAQSGADRVDWETTLDSDTGIAEAWASQQPQVTPRSQARSRAGGDVSALIVPLVAGVRTIGLVVAEADAPAAYPPATVEEVATLAAPAALRLEAALLFDEVRSLATNEERQRLAREIHDGVAQELVMVGYGIDNALAALPEGADQALDELRLLRNEVTRVITELRLSLFELRSEVDRQGGLAAAIAEYARTVGASAGLRVHLSLDESTARLPAAIEAELLRIAQEAITNARKHAGAENLWVTCAVDPPLAQVEVSDDGRGIGDQQSDGRYGLAIMAERAERIRGRLQIRPRDPSGTTVAVVLGSVPRRGSVSPPEGEKAGHVHDLDTDDTHQGPARR